MIVRGGIFKLLSSYMWAANAPLYTIIDDGLSALVIRVLLGIAYSSKDGGNK
jgi:hypothetical protein